MNAVWSDHDRKSIDLGDEPPIRTIDTRRAPPDRRAISLRWLTSTVLAALASSCLMAGALYAALDGRPAVAAIPSLEPETAARPGQFGGLVLKADFPDDDQEDTGSRRVMRLSTVTRDGERDIIRMRPFARVTTPLITDADDIVADIPSFDPLRIFAEANATTPEKSVSDSFYGADVEGEMAVKVVDFPVNDTTMVAYAPLSDVETEALVHDQAEFLTGADVKVASLPTTTSSRFDDSFAIRNSFEQLGVRIIPENVSFVAKSGDQVSDSFDDREEKIVTVGKGDTLQGLLIDNEATDDEALEINSAFRNRFAIPGVAPGEKLRIALAPANDETNRYHPVSVSIYRDGQHLATVALSDELAYVPAQEPAGGLSLSSTGLGESDVNTPRPRLYRSLYQTALDNDMSPRLIDDLIHVISYDVDFNARVSRGDSIDLFYSLADDGTETADSSELLYVSITLGGQRHRYYRFRSSTDGTVDYYDEDGRNAKKFLMRKPMSVGTFRRGFGMQRHPLLGYMKMHTGVDWAAPRGTPIMASGDATVVKDGWVNGYGNYIELRHANGYSTAYGHMSAFVKGMHKGMKVKQGQVIGYVGSTGLSTGPHLHFEILVNDRQVDPMRIRLPEGKSLAGNELDTFEDERARIDALLSGGTPPSNLAANDVKASGG
ncbi:Glycyl-glycine endopeptidase ALE-1 precursor [Hartmannibacter diazotrophicus]|uniref:Glycyl-glycine endopeptidase ALE-1 n=1 Tax=Hartmannibacter diazotrophicus TaxID=1482074 RepID=A0A2C9DBM3_9HYPH|nr:M23 family metallopeptidase [Hartmannibacter diazotrophicus]SON57666.1 Glycyl-glycine endopeptidase ALE-1 precursor [Hartmannibacter diazotrophicus]